MTFVRIYFKKIYKIFGKYVTLYLYTITLFLYFLLYFIYLMEINAPSAMFTFLYARKRIIDHVFFEHSNV